LPVCPVDREWHGKLDRVTHLIAVPVPPDVVPMPAA